MDKRGVNYAEFSAEINIPRTTLQGYLNDTSHPRADSMENLADKLGISVAEMVSGEEPSASAMDFDFDQILSTVPTLHPKVLPAAQQAASLLKSLLQLSKELYAAEERNVDTPYQNVDHLYCLHEMWDPSRRRLVLWNSSKGMRVGILVYDYHCCAFLQQQVCRSWVN